MEREIVVVVDVVLETECGGLIYPEAVLEGVGEIEIDPVLEAVLEGVGEIEIDPVLEAVLEGVMEVDLVIEGLAEQPRGFCV